MLQPVPAPGMAADVSRFCLARLRRRKPDIFRPRMMPHPVFLGERLKPVNAVILPVRANIDRELSVPCSLMPQ